MMYEIGVVYQNRNQIFIAVSDSMLVTWENGQFVERNPYKKYQPLRDYSVQKIIDKWDIDINTFDKLSEKYFKPKSCNDKNPPRKKKGSSDFFSRVYRIGT